MVRKESLFPPPIGPFLMPIAGREWDSETQAYLPIWGPPFSERYPSYQRLDISGSKTLFFGLYLPFF